MVEWVFISLPLKGARWKQAQKAKTVLKNTSKLKVKQMTRHPRIKDVCNSLNASVEKGVVNLANFVKSDNLDEAEKVQVSLENKSNI